MDDFDFLKGFSYYINNFQFIYSHEKNFKSWLANDKNDVIVISGDYFRKKFMVDDQSIGQYFYHPCSLAQAALGYFDNYVLTQNPEFKRLFLAQIEWLENN